MEPKKKKSVRLWAVVFWLLVWQGTSMALTALYPHGALLLASPLSALARLGELAVTAAFWQTALTSTVHILGGFLLACVLAVVLAALAARYRRAEELLAPLVSVVKAVPVASFIILVLLWFSGKNLSVIISMLMVFPVIYMNVLEGIRSADEKLLEMAQVFRLSVGKKLLYIYLPAVAPFFVSACSVSLGLCWKSGIAAEVIGTPDGSIGAVFYQAKIFLQTSELLAWTVVVVAVSVAFEKLFMFLLRLVLKKLKMEDVLNGKRA